MTTPDDIIFFAGSTSIDSVRDSSTFPIFSPSVLDFLDEISRLFFSSGLASQLPTISSFFFSIRRRNLNDISSIYLDGVVCWGRGLSFHITPSNVAATALYSWAFALLTGNPSVVRISSSVSCYLQPVLALVDSVYPKYSNQLPLFCFIGYPRNSETTNILSLSSDIRLIWGGDSTVTSIKSVPTKPACVDIPFPDRKSFIILDTSLFPDSDLQLQSDMDDLAKDIVLYSQLACSSPIILYLPQRCSFDSLEFKKFISFLSHSISSSQFLDFTEREHILSSFDTCLSSKDLTLLHHDESFSCFFCEPAFLPAIVSSHRPSNANLICTYLDSVNPSLPESSQTAVVYPFVSHHLRNLSPFLSKSSVSRFVPPGQAIDMSFFWDGHDIVRMMSRHVSGL